MWQLHRLFRFFQKKPAPVTTDEIEALMDLEGLTVVLIDMQAPFVRRVRKRVRARIISTQQQVISACIERDVPIVVLEYVNHGRTIHKLREVLERVPRKVFITKSNDDGFEEDGLREALEVFGNKTLLLMGVNADACVLKTAKSAVDLGYRVQTSENLIASGNSIIFHLNYKEWYLQNGCFIKATAR